MIETFEIFMSDGCDQLNSKECRVWLGLRDRKRAGAVLVLVMWLVLIAGLMLVGLNRVVQVGSARGQNELDRVRARWVARAGIEQAIYVLATDITSADMSSDFWYDDPMTFDRFELADGFVYSVASVSRASGGRAGEVRYGLDDEASRVNVNSASREVLGQLPDIREEQIASMIDWRDTNEESEPGGAEWRYYSQLPYPYEIRNGPMQTVREMLLVKGIEPDDFFGAESQEVGENGRAGLLADTTVYSYQLNQTMSGQERVNVKQTNRTTLQTRLGMSASLAERVVERADEIQTLFDLEGERGNGPAEEDEISQITLEWLAENYDEITVSEDEQLPARININTASREVLKTLPKMTDEDVDRLISVRAQHGGLSTFGILVKENVVSNEVFRAIAESITLRSNVFRVVSYGSTPSGVGRVIEAVIDRGRGQIPRVMYWYERE